MQIALGSTNQAKVAAVRKVVARIFPAAVVHALPVQVDVPAQPIGDEQTQAGAVARARAALQSTGADLGIGLEGGLRTTTAGWALCSWAAVVDKRGALGVGGSGILLLPRPIVERVLAGEELGPLMDELAQQTGTRHNLGASGVLTGGLVDRGRIFEEALICALAPWLHEAYQVPN